MDCYEPVTMADLGLKKGELVEPLSDREILAVHDYWTGQQIAAAIHWHKTGERIWSDTVAAGCASDLGVSVDDLMGWIDRGSELAWERTRERLTEEEIKALEAEVDRQMKEFDLEAFEQEKRQRKTEVEQFNALLDK